MNLNDTVALMKSDYYKDYQLAIRYKKLKAMLDSWDAGTLEFTPTCPRSTYNIQIQAMVEYLAALEARAVMENISLADVG